MAKPLNFTNDFLRKVSLITTTFWLQPGRIGSYHELATIFFVIIELGRFFSPRRHYTTINLPIFYNPNGQKSFLDFSQRPCDSYRHFGHPWRTEMFKDLFYHESSDVIHGNLVSNLYTCGPMFTFSSLIVKSWSNIYCFIFDKQEKKRSWDLLIKICRYYFEIILLDIFLVKIE